MLQQMTYFVAVVEEGTFLRAAERCNISQSAISQQIKALEGRLGVPLLRRSGRGFELTEAGEYFYNRSRSLLRSVDTLTKRTREIGDQAHSSLAVGYLHLSARLNSCKR